MLPTWYRRLHQTGATPSTFYLGATSPDGVLMFCVHLVLVPPGDSGHCGVHTVTLTLSAHTSSWPGRSQAISVLACLATYTFHSHHCVSIAMCRHPLVRLVGFSSAPPLGNPWGYYSCRSDCPSSQKMQLGMLHLTAQVPKIADTTLR